MYAQVRLMWWHVPYEKTRSVLIGVVRSYGTVPWFLTK